MVRTCCHAISAGTAGGDVWCKGLLPSVCKAFEFAFEIQPGALIFWQNVENENIIRAGGHTIAFTFATVSVNDRHEDAGFLFTVGLDVFTHYATPVSFASLLSFK